MFSLNTSLTKIKTIFSKNKVAFIIMAALFIVPWFWFSKGEVDFGGDSTRLYFYDPSKWLNNIALYFTNPLMSLGGNNPNFSMVPFLSFLILLKKILFNDPFVLNNVFNGMLLSGGFISIYLISMELLSDGKGKYDEIVSSISGLFFIFSPLLIFQWERALYSINQVFIYPLVFLMFLKFLKTKKYYILILIPIISLPFSINFSYATTPWLSSFSFFSLIFFSGYSIIYKRKKLLVKGLVLLVTFFGLLFSFDYIVEIFNIVSPFGMNYQMFFQKEAGENRALPYFLSIQPHVRLIYNLLNQDQFVITKGFGITFEKIIFNFGIKYLPVFFIYPIIIATGIILEKKNLIDKRISILHLLFVIFLINLYLTTATITNIGLSVYKSFFNIPGFSMFRSYYSKFAFTYVFFYALLLPLSLSIVVNKLKSYLSKVILFFLFLLTIFNGWPLISGSISKGTLWRSKGVKFSSKIDERYEVFLEQVGKERESTKVLSLPLINENYQLLQGENGGVYFGPSSLAILTAKNSFNGLQGFGPFIETFESAVENNNYKRINDLLSVLNVGYLFYNNDNYIYDNFVSFPYSDWLKENFPDQKSIDDFIKKLDFKKLFTFGNYSFFKKEQTLPRFYIASGINFLQGNTNLPEIMFNLENFSSLTANILSNISDSSNQDTENLKNKADMIIGSGDNIDNEILRTEESVADQGVFYPDVKKKLLIFWWPSLLKEANDHNFLSKDKNVIADKAIFFANKRINETVSFKKNEGIQLFFYKIEIKRLFKILEKLKENSNEKNKLAFKIRDNLTDNLKRLKLYSTKNIEQWESFINQYQLKLKLVLPNFNLNERNIALEVPKDGNYEVILKDVSAESTKLLFSESENISIDVNGNPLRKEKTALNGEGIFFGNMNLKKGNENFKIRFENQNNLLVESDWNSHDVNKKNTGPKDGLEKFDLPPAKIYLYQDISNWIPNTWYQVSGSVNAKGKIGILIAEKYKDRDETSETIKKIEKYRVLKRTSLNDENIASDGAFNFRVKSAGESISAKVIYFIEDSAVPIDEISSDIVKSKLFFIFDPKIIIKLKNNQPSFNEIKFPTLSFSKINPTNYKVTVKNAKNPYFLVFTEQFHDGWKIYPDEKLMKESCLKQAKNMSSQFGEQLTKLLSRLRLSQEVYEKGKTIDYLKGLVEEKDVNELFLPKNLFENWGKNSIANKNHYMANGYANLWYFTPDDFCNKESYTFLVEFQPQKYFYLGIVVSVFSLMAGLTALAIVGFLKFILKK